MRPARAAVPAPGIRREQLRGAVRGLPRPGHGQEPDGDDLREPVHPARGRGRRQHHARHACSCTRSPTIFSKHTFVGLTPDGIRLGDFLTNDPEMRTLATEYGFRTTDTGRVPRRSSPTTSWPSRTTLIDVIDPPTYETLESMITRLEAQYSGQGLPSAASRPTPRCQRSSTTDTSPGAITMTEPSPRTSPAPPAATRRPSHGAAVEAAATTRRPRRSSLEAAGAGRGRSRRRRPPARSPIPRPDRPSSTRWSRATSTRSPRSTRTAQAFTAKVQRHRQARRRRHPGVGAGLEPPARQAAGRDAERRADRDVGGQQVAAEPAPPGRGPRSGEAGRPASARTSCSACCRSATGDRLRDYFDKYRSSQHHLNSIITALYHGQDELQRDNAAIEQEKVNLWAVMGRLRQYAYLAQQPRRRP